MACAGFVGLADGPHPREHTPAARFGLEREVNKSGMADTAAVKVHTSAAAMSTPIGVELHPCFLAPPLFLLKVFFFFFLHPC